MCWRRAAFARLVGAIIGAAHSLAPADAFAAVDDEPAEPECPHPVGWKPASDVLARMLSEHRAWQADPATGRRAVLCNADLRSADLPGADLARADLRHAELAFAKLPGAQLTAARLDGVRLGWAYLAKAVLYDANLEGADLGFADLTGADMNEARLAKAGAEIATMAQADLTMADLQGATLLGADLKGADLAGTNLGGVEMAFADITGARYLPRGPPPDPFAVGIAGLSTVLISEGAEVGMVQLRALLRGGGLRDAEREATYAIEHNRTENLIDPARQWRRSAGMQPEPVSIDDADDRKTSSIHSFIEGWLRRVFFEWTVGYGLYPGRALGIIAGLLGALAPVYALAVIGGASRTRPSGLYRVWPGDRVEVRFGAPSADNALRVERLYRRDWWALGWGLYFSLLSAFHIGFREINVGSWIERVQPQEFALKPVGWVRVVSGLQSLASVYLLAIFILSYFGRPFE